VASGWSRGGRETEEEDGAGWFGMILKVARVWLRAEAVEDNRGSLMEAWGDAVVLQRGSPLAPGWQEGLAPAHTVDARLCWAPAVGAASMLLNVTNS